MARTPALFEGLRRFGLTLPGASEDHPWGETVLKAKGKVFVFLGRPGDTLKFSVKLPSSGERLLDQPFAEPTGYGLGKSGWITLTPDGALSRDELCALIEESYRTVAPKKLVQDLDARALAPAKSSSPTKPARRKTPTPLKTPARRKA